MKPTKLKYAVLLHVWLVFAASYVVAGPIGTAFTYQGRLASGTNAANGVYDFSFALFDDASAGTQRGPTLTTNGVPVANGLFTTTLDFGSVFDGNGRWLAVSVKTNGASIYTPLTPRQPLTPAPHAVFASSLSSNVNQTFSGTVTFSPVSGAPFAVGNSTKVLNLNADLLDGLDSAAFWMLSGNGGTTPGPNFLGTTDSRALELKVYGQRALRLEPTAGAPSFIAGASDNAAGYVGAAIGGGSGNNAYATYATIGGGLANKIQTGEEGGPYATIGGGERNTTWSYWATIGGGQSNTCDSAHGYPTIGGGRGNHNVAHYGTIGGGKDNYIREDFPLDHPGSTIAGGESNVVNTSYGSIGGGFANLVSTNYGTIAGGRFNAVANTSAFIGGGEGNLAEAFNSTVAGGFSNKINQLSAYSTIGGGVSNWIQMNPYLHAGSRASTIAGGFNNVVYGGADFYSSYVTIGGGNNNTVNEHSDQATIAGGGGNSVGGNGATIGGGLQNLIQSSGPVGSPMSVISGGQGNTVQGNTSCATIAGGCSNTVKGAYGMIPGGFSNSASMYAFAAGRRAKASNQGAFVWADSTDADFASTANNQFLIRAAGGVGVNTDSPGAALDVRGDVKMGSSSQYYAVGGGENLRIVRGIVRPDGTIYNGSGFTVTHTSTGHYSLTFTTAFADVPALILTTYSGSAPAVANCNSGTVSGYSTISTWAGSSQADIWWNFIAIGAR